MRYVDSKLVSVQVEMVHLIQDVCSYKVNGLFCLQFNNWGTFNNVLLKCKSALFFYKQPVYKQLDHE